MTVEQITKNVVYPFTNIEVSPQKNDKVPLPPSEEREPTISLKEKQITNLDIRGIVRAPHYSQALLHSLTVLLELATAVGIVAAAVFLSPVFIVFGAVLLLLPLLHFAVDGTYNDPQSHALGKLRVYLDDKDSGVGHRKFDLNEDDIEVAKELLAELPETHFLKKAFANKEKYQFRY